MGSLRFISRPPRVVELSVWLQCPAINPAANDPDLKGEGRFKLGVLPGCERDSTGIGFIAVTGDGDVIDFATRPFTLAAQSQAPADVGRRLRRALPPLFPARDVREYPQRLTVK